MTIDSTMSSSKPDPSLDALYNLAEHRVRRVWAAASGFDDHEEWNITPLEAAASIELREMLLRAANLDVTDERLQVLTLFFSMEVPWLYHGLCMYLDLDV